MNSTNYLLDTNVITGILRPKEDERNLKMLDWFGEFSKKRDISLFIPEVSYYEALRGRLLLKLKYSNYKGLDELEELRAALEYLPMTTEMWKLAAQLWADRQFQAQPKGKGLDGDTLLAAQAIIKKGVIITANIRHFSDKVSAFTWEQLSS